MRRDPPAGYRVSSYCTSCGRDFAADTYFDQHRVGVHEYTYSEGLDLDPPVEDGRRCATPDEMVEMGLRRMTNEEMLARRQHVRRVPFGVELWFDPIAVERMHRDFD